MVRYHGAFAPAAKRRKELVRAAPPPRPRTVGHRPQVDLSGSWAAMLWRVFEIDVLDCPWCPGRLKIIAVIQERAVIDRILEHLGHPGAGTIDLPRDTVIVYEAGAG